MSSCKAMQQMSSSLHHFPTSEVGAGKNVGKLKSIAIGTATQQMVGMEFEELCIVGLELVLYCLALVLVKVIKDQTCTTVPPEVVMWHATSESPFSPSKKILRMVRWWYLVSGHLRVSFTNERRTRHNQFGWISRFRPPYGYWFLLVVVPLNQPCSNKQVAARSCPFFQSWHVTHVVPASLCVKSRPSDLEETS